MDLDTITALVIAVAPSVVAVGTALGTLIKIIKDFNTFKEELKNRTDYYEFRNKLNLVIQENLELKQTIKEILEYSKQHPLIKPKED